MDIDLRQGEFRTAPRKGDFAEDVPLFILRFVGMITLGTYILWIIGRLPQY